MAAKITRSIKSTRIHVATIDPKEKTVKDLPDVVVEGHVPQEKMTKHTKDVILGYEYDNAMYEMDVAMFIENARKLSDEEVAKIETQRAKINAEKEGK